MDATMAAEYAALRPACTEPFTGGPDLAQVCTANSVAVFLTILNTLVEAHPKIGDPCGRVQPTEKVAASYDFVVIGAGAAGAAVAARLSDIPEWKVLLLEAGPDEPAGMEIPANYGVYLNTYLDWAFKTTNETHACLSQNGSCVWPRGKNLGGTTGHHGMGYHRGHAADYERWVKWGNVGWSFDDVLPFFKKSEDNHEIGRVNPKYHGTGGPMSVERFPWKPEVSASILEAADEAGYDIVEELIADQITGFTIAQTMSKNGVRQSSAAAFLRPLRDRKNLDIAVNATATKILTRNKKVRGVEFVMNDKKRTVKVKREVIVSGGAVNSPQLLLLSGIGPAEDLQKLGIPVVLDLPGVGKNLHNHVSYGLDFTMPQRRRTSYDYGDVDLYLANQTGPLSSTGLAQMTGILASKYTTPDDPDMQFFFSGYQESCIFDGTIDGKVSGDDTSVRFTIVNLHAKSRGEISLASNDPLKDPGVWGNDLSDPADVEVLIEGIHILRRIANTETMRKTGLKLAAAPEPECDEYEFLSDDYFRCAVRWSTRVENHQGGSCKMGPASDPMAVVDPELRVHGIRGLRVADASIMPQMVSGNPHAPITMIGERAVDFIKKTYVKCTYV